MGPSTEPIEPIDRLLAPFRDFTQRAASGGVLLIGAAIVALVWANSAFADSYAGLWATPLTVGIGDLAISKPLLLWINDGLMAVFFFVVGLEIKREALVGELASVRTAALPIAAALGGAVLPAAIFLGIVGTSGGEAVRGWAIPMATDIAFALGVLALLGRRVALGLRVFVTALAIVDDLVAVLIIALFYTSDLSTVALAAAGAILACLIGANRLGVRHPLVYGVLGIALWVAFLQSGIHATVAGVLLALTVPARVRIDPVDFARRARGLLSEFADRSEADDHSIDDHHAALWDLETLTEHAQAPMLRMEHALQPWVTFAIIPLFALANAGVSLGGGLASMTEPVALGVLLGLVVGKQVGITLAAWAVVRSGWASLPGGVTWRHIYGASWLGGIGFTMSLFIADLGYGDGPELMLAKIGILAASIIAGAGGYLILRSTPVQSQPEPPD